MFREQAYEWSDEVNDLVDNLHHNASQTCHFLHNMHVCLAEIKEKVSDSDYVKIMSYVTLPLTTVEVVQYTDKGATANVDEDRIRHHMPNARKFQGRKKDTSLFACLVHYIMRCNFVNDPKAQLGYTELLNCLVSVSPLSGEYLQVWYVRVVMLITRKRLRQPAKRLKRRSGYRSRKSSSQLQQSTHRWQRQVNM